MSATDAKPVSPSPAAAPASPPAAKKAAAKKAAAGKTVSAQAPAKKAAVPAAAPAKTPKEKLVRDSFTMPRSDFALIDQLKERAIGFKHPVKKSELLRAGLQTLASLSDAKLLQSFKALTPLKTGRPKKNNS